jgi:hypothetical protein
MASDYVDAFERLADSWNGDAEQSQKSTFEALQSA